MKINDEDQAAIATVLHAQACGCSDWFPGDTDDPQYDHQATEILSSEAFARIVQRLADTDSGCWHFAYSRWYDHREAGHEVRAAVWGFIADRIVDPPDRVDAPWAGRGKHE